MANWIETITGSREQKRHTSCAGSASRRSPSRTAPLREPYSVTTCTTAASSTARQPSRCGAISLIFGSPPQPMARRCADRR